MVKKIEHGRKGLSLIYPGFLFRVIPYSVPWFETVQGSHPIFFQKTSGLSHISENHISETGCSRVEFVAALVGESS